ncbi:MAG: hypothetical protein LBR07_05210 [Puniceicoccales bacterium]|jgi:hypothetical protein|nr:hypothetical protein [Puniceicoccales bacterium]
MQFSFTDAEVAALNRKIRLGVEVKRHLHRSRQQRIARASERLGGHRVDGLGQLRARIDLDTFLRWQIAEPGIWEDPASVKAFLRDNDDMRVKG